MQKNHNSLDLQREAEYKQKLAAGLRLSESALPYLATRQFEGIMSNIAQRDLPEEARATTALMLSMPNLLQGVRGNNSDASIHSAMHAAMGELIDNAYNTNVTKTALVNACVRFCKQNGLVQNGDDIAKLENEIMTNLTSVWHEHCWENLLLAAGANVERANRGDDLGGTDLWVELPDGSWVSVDVKTQPQTIFNHADRKGRQVYEDYRFPAGSSTAPDFELFTATSSEHRSAYAAFSNPPSSGSMAPIDFRGQAPAIKSAQDVVNTLWYYAENGYIKRYRQVKTQNGVSFIPASRKVTQS